MEQKDINFVSNYNKRKSKLSLLTLFLMVVSIYINKCFNYIGKMFLYQNESKEVINNESNDCYNKSNDDILKRSK